MPGVTADPFACNQKPTTWKSYSLKSCVAAFGGAQKHFYRIKHTLALVPVLQRAHIPSGLFTT